MRFLTDQDVYQLTIEFLIKEHHDVITVRQLGLERASDIFLLRKAKEMERIFVTRDKDFGTLVFFEEEASPGVIFMRGKPKEIKLIHSELGMVLKNHTEAEMNKYFCVVEPGKHRLRKLKR
jgi:predicted nuclease of predicted toxin-antitoxin system